jgi:hypothetical protein
MRIYAWVIIGLTICVVVVRLAVIEMPVALEPDREGKVTFHGPNYQLRVPRQLVALVMRAPDGTDIVELSVDGREFGSSDAPGPRRIWCTPDWACADYCAPTPENQTPGCPDVTNGWYRVMIIPGFLRWGRRESAFPQPNAGPGFNCGNDGHPELEFCWDPARFTPSWPVANVHDVPYTACTYRQRPHGLA